MLKKFFAYSFLALFLAVLIYLVNTSIQTYLAFDNGMTPPRPRQVAKAIKELDQIKLQQAINQIWLSFEQAKKNQLEISKLKIPSIFLKLNATNLHVSEQAITFTIHHKINNGLTGLILTKNKQSTCQDVAQSSCVKLQEGIFYFRNTKK